MAVPSVHWHEGMFLWPQQMQQAERFVSQQIHLSGVWDTHYSWGLRAFELDPVALANFRFVVSSLRARLRDGTLLDVPDETSLPALELKEALEQPGGGVTVLLAVPRPRQNQPNVAKLVANEELPPELADVRYWVETQELEDENIGADSQPIEVRRFHVKLLLSTEDPAGYEVLPLARIKRSSQADGLPEIDISYIPPLLACDAWKPARDGILQQIYDRFGGWIATLAAQVVTRGISFDTRNQGDAHVLAALQVLNEAYTHLRVLAFADGVHPLTAYLELCRLAGRLAIFNIYSSTKNPRAPDLPQYDHDDLGKCFYAVKREIDLFEPPVPKYEERPFVGEDLRMQVKLEEKWLAPTWEMYVGVETPLSASDCVRLLTRPGQLDMKIGSALRVDEIFARGAAGLRFAPSPTPPRALPSRPDLVFFQVNRDAQQSEWHNVQESLTLAIRLNPQRIAGNIQGQRTLTIKPDKSGTQTTTMQFTLFLVPRE